MLKKIFIIIIIAVFIPKISFCADIQSLEREALALRVEYNRLGSQGDPFERRAILQEIIDKCKGTEEAETAYWELADLYLDGFPEEMRKEACEMLELCLKEYPNSNRVNMIKRRLVDLYDEKNPRRAELINQLRNDKSLPDVLK